MGDHRALVGAIAVGLAVVGLVGPSLFPSPLAAEQRQTSTQGP
jgi:hypothetical protein